MKRRGGQEKRGVSAPTLARDNGVKLKHRQGMDCVATSCVPGRGGRNKHGGTCRGGTSVGRSTSPWPSIKLGIIQGEETTDSRVFHCYAAANRELNVYGVCFIVLCLLKQQFMALLKVSYSLHDGYVVLVEVRIQTCSTAVTGQPIALYSEEISWSLRNAV